MQSLRRFASGCKRRFWDLLKRLDKYRVETVQDSSASRVEPAEKSSLSTFPSVLPSQATMVKQIDELVNIIELLGSKANETERPEIRNEVVSESVRTDPDHRKARPAPPSVGGNRRQRRKAAALARKER
jgi:hypothetical protein